jgi:drug/metabolite transporter (DMT)-like permease
MNSFVIVLVLCSSIMHASWNLLARRKGTETIFFLRMITVVILAGAIPAVTSELIVHSLPIQAWICVIGAGFFCGFYFFCLARSYESSDFTIVYPIARSLPVLLVGIGDLLRGRDISLIGWLGMSLVVIGCFLVPLRSFDEFHLHRYVNRANLWMLFTALGTVGYTLLDKTASEVVLQGPATAARYGYFFFIFAYISYILCLRISRTGRSDVKNIGWRLPALSGLLNFSSYWLILWAYQLMQQASYILAFRQTSIAIGVVTAFVIYKEEGKIPRLIGTVILTAGLTLIALWGS